MHTVDVANIKAHLNEIIHHAECGEEVIVIRDGELVVKIISVKNYKAFKSHSNLRAKINLNKTSSEKLVRHLRNEARY